MSAYPQGPPRSKDERRQGVDWHTWSQDAAVIDRLVAAGYLDPSSYAEMDARLGLPRRKIPVEEPRERQ